MTFVYLASPYTPHAGESIEQRVDAACKWAARLMERGEAVFSPIAHSHAIAEHLMPTRRFDHDFWLTQDLAVLKHCQKLYVLMLPGWERSRGVAAEIACAEACRIPIEYIQP